MKLQASINDKGKITIDLSTLLDGMDAASLMELSEHLGCTDAVIAAVADQIIHGRTESGSHGLKGYDPTYPTTALDAAIRRVAESSSEVAKSEIARLMDQCREQERRINHARDELRKRPGAGVGWLRGALYDRLPEIPPVVEGADGGAL